MTDENKPEEERPKIKWTRAPEGVFETYSNGTHLAWSLDDVRLRFAQLGQSDKSLTPGDALVSIYIEKATITLTWRNAKILLVQLSQVIANYEKVNGQIDLEPKLASNEAV
jgi:hypothetical protein